MRISSAEFDKILENSSKTEDKQRIYLVTYYLILKQKQKQKKTKVRTEKIVALKRDLDNYDNYLKSKYILNKK